MSVVSEYNAAKALGESAVREAIKNGMQPYLPVLDQIAEIKQATGEVHLGLMELPLDRITGNKEASRSNAFANNFMPILESSSEFASKWRALYESYRQNGIRDAIKCYEYMNRYYVQEGNKRVSVSKYGGSDFILADVTRILPAKTETRENKVYFEYLDFYNVTKNFYIVFNEPGEYAKLAELLGQDLVHKWPVNLCRDLKAAFFKFCNIAGAENDPKIAEAFLVYITIFPMKALLEESEEIVSRNILRIRDEILVSLSDDRIEFFDTAPKKTDPPKLGTVMNSDVRDLPKTIKVSSVAKMMRRRNVGKILNTNLSELFTAQPRKYTADDPIRTAFIYDKGIEESRWTDSHEAGRLYLNEMIGGNAVSACYVMNGGESVCDVIDRAVKDGSEIIFTVKPEMMEQTFKSALQYPDVKFFNCSMGSSISSVRCYQGKLYEAAFLMGILAADILLRSGSADIKIGYISSSAESVSYSVMNAFAVGVSLIDPECRVLLAYGTYEGCRSKWDELGITILADIEYADVNSSRKPGVYALGETDRLIGTPHYVWGRFYLQIVQSVISGAYNVEEIMTEMRAVNYWFGLSAGVVDILVPDIPYQTKKLLSFFKNALMNGTVDPFSGELRSDRGIVQEQEYSRRSGIPAELTQMKASDIASMEWFNDNIDLVT